MLTNVILNIALGGMLGVGVIYSYRCKHYYSVAYTVICYLVAIFIFYIA